MFIATPHTHQSGYFLNNSSYGKKEQADIQLCTHCEVVIMMQKWKEDGGFCSCCMAPICGPCADRMLIFGCEPFIKKIEVAFETAVKLKQHRKLVGLDEQPADFVPKLIVPA
jgi:hypothetical protein